MRKRWYLAILLFFTVLLGGCGEAAVTEFVTDSVPVSAPVDPRYEVTVSVPQEAQGALPPRGAERVYRPADGRYEIEVKSLLAESAESAVHQLSGFPAEELNVVKTSRFSMPEYRFAWYAPDGADGWVCRADLLQDGERFYCVICRVRESAEENCGQLAVEVFSTVGLFTDEGA
jgi:hypothetical protein